MRLTKYILTVLLSVLMLMVGTSMASDLGLRFTCDLPERIGVADSVNFSWEMPDPYVEMRYKLDMPNDWLFGIKENSLQWTEWGLISNEVYSGFIAEGNYTFTVEARSPSGVIQIIQHKFQVDYVPPEVLKESVDIDWSMVWQAQGRKQKYEVIASEYKKAYYAWSEIYEKRRKLLKASYSPEELVAVFNDITITELCQRLIEEFADKGVGQAIGKLLAPKLLFDILRQAGTTAVLKVLNQETNDASLKTAYCYWIWKIAEKMASGTEANHSAETATMGSGLSPSFLDQLLNPAGTAQGRGAEPGMSDQNEQTPSLNKIRSLDKTARDKQEDIKHELMLDFIPSNVEEVPNATEIKKTEKYGRKNNAQELIRKVRAEGDIWTEPATGMQFAWVPGGCFQMGSSASEKERGNDEGPVHEVCVDGFWMGKTEVTQGQWQMIMGNNPSHFKNGDNYPVEQISWDDTQDYIRKLGSRSGKSFYLPTEAEWEYAARSGGKNQQYSGGSDLHDVAWYSGNSGVKTYPVAQKRSNGLGLYDMSGNVWEWCQDRYDKDYYHNSPRNNPQGPSSGSYRVFRGGSWSNGAKFCRSAIRYGNTPGVRGPNLGLRLVLRAGVPSIIKFDRPDSTIKVLKVAIKEKNNELFTSCFVIKEVGEWLYNAIISEGKIGEQGDEGYENWKKYILSSPPETDRESKYVLSSYSFEYHYSHACNTWEEAKKRYEEIKEYYGKTWPLSYRRMHWVKKDGKWLISDI